MKVILLGATPPPVGGIAKWTARMLSAPLKNNWKIVLVDEKMIGREPFGDNTKINYIFELQRCIRIWSKLIQALGDKDSKIVHLCPIGTRNSLLAEIVNASLSKCFHKKVILHFMCTLPNMIDNRLKDCLLRILCKKSDLIIALNSQTKQYLETKTDVNTIVIPNFVDFTEISAGNNEINESIKTVLYSGGVISEKGCAEIINVAPSFPDIEFRLAGNASKEMIEMAKDVSNVKLLGVLDKTSLQNELNDADLYIFLSYYAGEGFSNALAEAMAAGLPCIVSDWAANAEMIDDEHGGIVVPIKDIPAVENAIRKEMPYEIRKRQGRYNLDKAANYYSQGVVTDRYVECYEELSK